MVAGGKGIGTVQLARTGDGGGCGGRGQIGKDQLQRSHLRRAEASGVIWVMFEAANLATLQQRCVPASAALAITQTGPAPSQIIKIPILPEESGALSGRAHRAAGTGNAGSL